MTRYTKHARDRMRQRGKSEQDVNLILQCATEVGDGSLLLLRKDVDREVTRRKREIEKLERLIDCKVVFSDGLVITLYHATRKHQKALKRRYG